MLTRLAVCLAAAAAVLASNRGDCATPDRFAISFIGHCPDVILVPVLASSEHVWDATVTQLSPTHRVHVVQVADFARTPTDTDRRIDGSGVQTNPAAFAEAVAMFLK